MPAADFWAIDDFLATGALASFFGLPRLAAGDFGTDSVFTTDDLATFLAAGLAVGLAAADLAVNLADGFAVFLTIGLAAGDFLASAALDFFGLPLFGAGEFVADSALVVFCLATTAAAGAPAAVLVLRVFLGLTTAGPAATSPPIDVLAFAVFALAGLFGLVSPLLSVDWFSVALAGRPLFFGVALVALVGLFDTFDTLSLVGVLLASGIRKSERERTELVAEKKTLWFSKLNRTEQN